MASLNRCEFIGNLGADPETRYAPSGTAIANFRIACSETWKDKNTGEKQERTEWVRLVAFNRLAEVVGEYLKKGSQVYVAGKMQTRKWQDQSGNDRYSTEVVVGELVMLGTRDRNGTEDRPRPAPAEKEAPANDFYDDEIPF